MTIFKDQRLQPFIWFVYGAIVTTALCGLVSMTVQQNYRQSLNDPQIQMAEDAAHALAAGEVPAGVVPRGPLIDLKNSLAPWIAVYDTNGAVLEASGQLNNAPPQPPKTLFNQSSWIGSKSYDTPAGAETRVTWESPDGVRQALVLVHLPDGRFVAAGRNMSEVEARESDLSAVVFLAWIVTLGALFILSVFLWWVRKE